MDDRALLEKFINNESETAFAELTTRYASQVYGAACRQIGDADKARDITQTVFILLARKASTLRRHAVLAAWLFRATRLVASNMRKYDARRQQRETKAAIMTQQEHTSANEPRWEDIQPYLDESIARLCETERSAVLLSFFHKLSHKETGDRLGLSEEAVRKRIQRALAKMRSYFQKRGVSLSGELLAGILIAHNMEAAPLGLTAGLAAATTKSGVAKEGVTRMVDEALNQMFWAKTKAAVTIALGSLTLLVFAGLLLRSPSGTGVRYSGMSDASAAVWAGDGLFLVADDEVNHINLYSAAQGDQPIQSFDFNAFLNLDKNKMETDWEGATRIDNRSYWITSHGQNREGKTRSSRHRLVALDIQWRDGKLDLTPVGRPYTELVEDLSRHPAYRDFQLEKAAVRAPKSTDALNIEGLCATPEGALLIGFRNPLPQGKALLAPLLNPAQVIAGGRPDFGPPILLDLGGLGVRDITRKGNTYYIIGGPVGGQGGFGVFEWDENDSVPKRVGKFNFAGLTPEALLIAEDQGTNWGYFLSDDGTRSQFGKIMKKSSLANRSFRVLKAPLP